MSGVVASGGISSTILYKFRSSTNYESLPMPGSMARLFDIKRAIVKAKKLDKATGGGLEFDLRITNAATEEVYSDDSLLLPRGTRVIVQRLPAARGTGLLARIAREEAGLQASTRPAAGENSIDSSKFYTITSAEEDEFVRGPAALDSSSNNAIDDEEDELRALRAVTEPTQQGSGKVGAIIGYNHRAGASIAGASAGIAGQHASNWAKNSTQHNFRPTTRAQADPELRELEQKQMTKKRATGIPRTFLNFVDKPNVSTGEGGVDGSADGVDSSQQQETAVRLQPNQLGFQQLLQRAGGKSSGKNPQVVLQNALTITATTIPDYLKCGICGNVVQGAMLLPWDREGRTACETCIRPALARNNFVCPLTGTENVSPDELIPNFGLRKAAENFVASVLDKIEEIEKEAQKLAEEVNAKDNLSMHNQNLFHDSAEHGTLETKKTKRQSTNNKADYGGGGRLQDDFGGDVFDVDPKDLEDDSNTDRNESGSVLVQNSSEANPNLSSEVISNTTSGEAAEGIPSNLVHAAKAGGEQTRITNASDSLGTTKISPNANGTEPSVEVPTEDHSEFNQKSSSTPMQANEASAVTDHQQTHRGPPAGYAIGPAAPTALNNPRMALVTQPASSIPPLSIPPPPPGIPPVTIQQYPQRGRGFQPYLQRGAPRGRTGRFGGFSRGGPVGSRFGGRGDAPHAAGREGDRRQALDNSPAKEVVALQEDESSAVSHGKRDRSDSSTEQEGHPSIKSPEDGSKSRTSKRIKDSEVETSKSEREPTGSRNQPRRSQATQHDRESHDRENSSPQTRPYAPHHVRGGRGMHRSPEASPFFPGRSDRGRWHSHLPPQVAPLPYYPHPPPYGVHFDAFGLRGRGRDFRGGGRPFYRGGRF